MRSVAKSNANLDSSYSLFQRYKTLDEMDPHDLELLTTFHPLNEPVTVKFPENVADEDKEINTQQAKVDDSCPHKKFESFGSTKSSGRGRGKLREPVEDDLFIARELRELSDQRSSFVFSGFRKSSNLNFVSSGDSVKKATENHTGFEEKSKGSGVTEAVTSQKKLGRGRGRARNQAAMVNGVL